MTSCSRPVALTYQAVPGPCVAFSTTQVPGRACQLPVDVPGSARSVDMRPGPYPRLPRLRWPAWADRAAEHPRAWWTVTAVCVAACLALIAVMAAGGLYPVTDWNGPRGLKPGHAAPTVAAGRAH